MFEKRLNSNNRELVDSPCLRLLAFMLILRLLSANPAHAQSTSFELEPINYHTAEVHDAVAQLAEKVRTGEVKLKYENGLGYLPSLLEALDIPTSSQSLVFSKTSLQLNRINPRRPRALYFNDDVYVGFCQRGNTIEIAATDPKQGATFYTLKQEQIDKPEFVRDQGQCLICHANTRTQNVPGYLVRSVFADRAGHPILGSGTFTSSQSSPFSERWGGWYVTGTHGNMRHMGNTIYARDEKADLESGANIENLENLEMLSTEPYLTPHSDIVALMVLEHQTQMHNALAAANYGTRQAVFQSQKIDEMLEQESDELSESAQRRISGAADNVLAYLLMCDEFELTSPVKGTSSYAQDFMAGGKRDSKGRSLRDFDLQTRMFKYPCSYLIHSPAFDNLPKPVRDVTIERLKDILQGRDDLEQYAHLSAEDRQAILEILKETKPDLFTCETKNDES